MDSMDEMRRKAREETNRAIASAIGSVACSMAAASAFHPDPRIAGHDFIHWQHVAILAPLIATGTVSVQDVAGFAPERAGRE